MTSIGSQRYSQTIDEYSIRGHALDRIVLAASVPRVILSAVLLKVRTYDGFVSPGQLVLSIQETIQNNRGDEVQGCSWCIKC